VLFVGVRAVLDQCIAVVNRCLLTAFDDGAGNSVSKIRFNIMLSPARSSRNWPSTFGFTLSYVYISRLSQECYAPSTCLILRLLVNLIIFDEAF
jgi:hypothetical protein